MNEVSNDGGAALIKEFNGGQVKVGWINNNELIFGNADNDGCDGVVVEVETAAGTVTSSTCANVGDNFSV